MGFYVNLCDNSWCICQGCHNPAVLTRGQKVAFPSASSKAKIILWWTFYLLPIWWTQKRSIQRRSCLSKTKLTAAWPYHSCRNLDCKKSINYACREKNIIILYILNEITSSTTVCLQSKNFFPSVGTFVYTLTCTAMKVHVWGLSLDLDHLQMSACLLLNLIFITSA